jgi:NAD(P)-dependent dehydrogenase (short-subunit alcohol dehydrogenase family)
MRLKDEVILITGSTTGIGEFMARRFVAEGAKVILH